MTRLILLLALAICSLSPAAPDLEKRVQALELAVHRLLDENATLRAKIDYPINDQHDGLLLSLEEALADARTNRWEKQFRLVTWEHLEEAYAGGSIPEATMTATRLAMKLDELSEKAASFRVETVRTKIKSLDGLKEGKILLFARNDRDMNLAQLNQFTYELKKAEATAAHVAEHYRRIHETHLTGAIPWATDHEAELNAKKTAEAVEAWKRKVIEQEKQYLAAVEEVKKLEGPRR